MSYIAVLCSNRSLFVCACIRTAHTRTRTPITAHKFCNHFLPFDKFGRLRLLNSYHIHNNSINSILFYRIMYMRRPALDSKVRMHTDERFRGWIGVPCHAVIGKGKEIKSKTAVVPVIKITMPTNLTTIKYVIHTKIHVKRTADTQAFALIAGAYTKQYTYKSISTDKQQRTTHLSPSTYLCAQFGETDFTLQTEMHSVHRTNLWPPFILFAGTLLFVVLSSIQNYFFRTRPNIIKVPRTTLFDVLLVSTNTVSIKSKAADRHRCTNKIKYCTLIFLSALLNLSMPFFLPFEAPYIVVVHALSVSV